MNPWTLVMLYQGGRSNIVKTKKAYEVFFLFIFLYVQNSLFSGDGRRWGSSTGPAWLGDRSFPESVPVTHKSKGVVTIQLLRPKKSVFQATWPYLSESADPRLFFYENTRDFFLLESLLLRFQLLKKQSRPYLKFLRPLPIVLFWPNNRLLKLNYENIPSSTKSTSYEC